MLQDVEITLIGMNEIAQEGLKRILTGENFRVKAMDFRDIADTVSEIDPGMENTPQIFMVDSSVNGEVLEVCERIHRCYPNGRVVVLADGFEYDEVARAFRGGIDGYILKAISCEPLFGLLRLIALGEKVLPSQLADSLCQHQPMAVNDDWDSSVRAVTLSSREVEVLACLSLGMANKVISRRHNITEATVKVHVKAILRKLHVANRTQAAIWAVQHGLDPELQINGETADLREEQAEDTQIPQIWMVPAEPTTVRTLGHHAIPSADRPTGNDQLNSASQHQIAS